MQGKHIPVAVAVVLAAGVGGAAAVMLAPPPNPGAEPTRLRELAERTGGPASMAPTLTEPEATQPAAPTEVPAPAAAEQPSPVVVRTAQAEAPAAARPVSTRRSSQPTDPASPAPAPAQDEAVKSIALTGVTSQGGQEQALLFDLNSRERQAVAVGGSAFGFTVRRIEPEAVVLARGASEYTIRLGDKTVPTNDAVAVASTGGEDGSGSGRGFGDRSGFGRRGDRGFGGSGGDDAERARRRAEFFARFGGQNGRPSFATGSANSGGGEATTFSGGGENNRSDSERGRDGRSRSNWQPTFQPAFNPAFMMGGWGSGRNNSQSSFTNAPTTNPQTARRRGGGLVGGASGTDGPDPINNPQTQRRLGNTSGPAFGQDQATSGNRSGFNRPGNNFGRGTSSR